MSFDYIKSPKHGTLEMDVAFAFGYHHRSGWTYEEGVEMGNDLMESYYDAYLRGVISYGELVYVKRAIEYWITQSEG